MLDLSGSIVDILRMYWYGVGALGVFKPRPKLYVRIDEVGEMGFEPGMIVVMEAFDGRLLDDSVHPLATPLNLRFGSRGSIVTNHRGEQEEKSAPGL